MSDIIRAYRARVPMPRESSDDAPVPGFVNTYAAIQRQAERNERANDRGAARIYRAVRQSAPSSSVETIPSPKAPGIVKAFVFRP